MNFSREKLLQSRRCVFYGVEARTSSWGVKVSRARHIGRRHRSIQRSWDAFYILWTYRKCCSTGGDYCIVGKEANKGYPSLGRRTIASHPVRGESVVRVDSRRRTHRKCHFCSVVSSTPGGSLAVLAVCTENKAHFTSPKFAEKERQKDS